jgi:ABC-type Zn uptake system ZnuABC Zn-binding protein ZnuA
MASLVLLAGAFLAAAPRTPAAEKGPLKVCATIPDLGSLCKEVGGDDVQVTVFAKGPQDPHFLDARPSFIKELSRADLFILVGLDLEVGWAPNLWQNARNGNVLPGAEGFLDASGAIAPREVPASGFLDRSMGDVHPLGNPHYLLDPVSGLEVAAAIRQKLEALRPEKREQFSSRYDAFAKRLNSALVGEKLAAKYDASKLAVLAEHGKLEEFLKGQGDEGLLGGWLKRMAPFKGVPVVADHNLLPYFSARFGLDVVGFLEPKPGIAPTTKHLSGLIEKMKSLKIRGILTVPYFDSRHVRFVTDETGAAAIELAHQCGARPGTDDYISMVEHNVSQVEKVLGGGK